MYKFDWLSHNRNGRRSVVPPRLRLLQYYKCDSHRTLPECHCPIQLRTSSHSPQLRWMLIYPSTDTTTATPDSTSLLIRMKVISHATTTTNTNKVQCRYLCLISLCAPLYSIASARDRTAATTRVVSGALDRCKWSSSQILYCDGIISYFYFCAIIDQRMLCWGKEIRISF